MHHGTAADAPCQPGDRTMLCFASHSWKLSSWVMQSRDLCGSMRSAGKGRGCALGLSAVRCLQVHSTSWLGLSGRG